MGTWTRREFLRDTATLVVGAAGGVFPTGPATASQHVLRFGWQPAIGASMAAAIAYSKGFDRELGFEIKRFFTLSGPQMNEALGAGEIEGANMGGLPGITAFVRGIPVKAVLSSGYGGDFYAILVPKGSRIRSVQQLAGRKIGVPIGSGAHQFLFKLAAVEKVPLSELTLMNMALDVMPSALTTGQVDAVAMWEPSITAWLWKGVGDLLVRGVRDFPGYGFMVLRDDVLQKRPETAYKFVVALARAYHLLRTDRSGEATAIAARDFQMDRKLIEATMGTRTADPRFTTRFHEFMRESSEFLVQIGRLRQVPDTSRYIHTELLERAQREYPQYFVDLRS